MKTALITGASRGIGRAIALHLAEDGSYPLLCLTAHTNDVLLHKLADEIRDAHPTQSVLCSVGDAGDISYVVNLREELHAAGGTLHLLINNAAISFHGLLMDQSPEEWDRVIRTDLTSVYNTCHTFMDDLIKASRKVPDPDIPSDLGRIINISSIWGEVGASCEAAYSAAKGGVNALTKALARELALSDVPVNAIQPGVVDTEMNNNLTSEEKASLAAELPSGRFVTPDEVAKAVLGLAKMPPSVTGTILRVDGGWAG